VLAVAVFQLRLRVSARGGRRADFGVVTHGSKPKGVLRRQAGRSGGSASQAAVVGKRNHVFPKYLCLRLLWAGKASYGKSWL